MSRITDSKVSGQYIPSLSLSRYYEKRKKKCGHSKEDKTKRRRTWCCFAPPPPFEQPVVVVVVIPGMFGRDSIVGNARLLLLERLCPSRNRRFYKGVLGNFFVCVRVFLAQKKTSKIRGANTTNPNTCMHSYQTKRGGAYYTSSSKTRPPSLANIHPSIGRRTTTPTGSKRRPPSPL